MVYLKSINCILVHLLILILNFLKIVNTVQEEKIRNNVVQSWSEKIAFELWNVGTFITKREEVIKSYEKSQIVPRKGETIVEDIAKEIKNMFEAKVSAIKRIMDAAENKALSDNDEPVDNKYTYYSSKEMIEIPEFGGPIGSTEPPIFSEIDELKPKKRQQKQIVLNPNKRFNNEPVNTSVSSVHVPTNVYDRAPDVIKAIKWSEALDSIFIDNYRIDPSLSWQYFASSTGFLRQFPAAKWEANPVDLYDARLRTWYIEAANSPKDLIILVDNSGSMTGQRKDIARHIVENILETLSPNDYVNVLLFNETVEEVVPCFRDTLVQANMLNVGEFKLHLENIETKAIANFSAALTKAFEMLQQFKSEGNGAQCNQAIMLISDGVPFFHKDVFETYNRELINNKTTIPVRMFTYLIGKEVADVEKVKWMACGNLGYYVHLSTLAEVREQVLNYIQVLARPLVLNKTNHPVIFSQIYADVVDPKMTEYEWEIEERTEQKEIYRPRLSETPYDHKNVQKWWARKGIMPDQTSSKYNFMITISMPVFDRRESATPIANLLGVAATDIPVREIQKLMMPFVLGVNGYAFLVTNNGYIIGHPDHRPIFRDILKPAYNDIDLTEVELMDDDKPIREFGLFLLNIRDQIINQSTGSKWVFVKYHQDNMKRVSKTKRYYFWTPIEDTPYTLVITYPGYQSNRIQTRSEDEIHRIIHSKTDILSFFLGRNWKIHPDWLYCKHSTEVFDTPEKELKYFLKRMKSPGWKWPLSKTPIPPEYAVYLAQNKSTFEKDRYYCDRALMQSLVNDAKITQFFSKNFTQQEKGDEFKQRFGITVAFIATHSGLTRWQEFSSNHMNDVLTGSDFSEQNVKSIDEIWYKRAVEQHYVENESFVYSVPFSNVYGDETETLVTASHAIFVQEGQKSASAAVVGYQFQLDALDKLFKNITNNVRFFYIYICVLDQNCKYNCGSDEIDCYIIDNNGYILISPKLESTGRFFGEVRGDIMRRLIDEGIYKRVIIYDYQAVCFYEKGNNNNKGVSLKSVVSSLLNTWKLIYYILTYLMLSVKSVMTDTFENLGQLSDDIYEIYEEFIEPTESTENNNMKDKEQKLYKLFSIKKTKPQPCDQTLNLYQLNVDKNDKVFNTPANECIRPFVITPIAKTNLLLLVIDTVCPSNDFVLTTEPISQVYGNYSLACFKNDMNSFSRKRPNQCITNHENEKDMLCGNAYSNSIINVINYIFCLFFIFYLR
uniref:CSON011477 protein n=1 Tax=Culicoides sonorensis TaxID=179676 RepID=A0A336LHN4_CULSO